MKDMIAKTMGEKSHKTKIEIKFLVLQLTITTNTIL